MLLKMLGFSLWNVIRYTSRGYRFVEGQKIRIVYRKKLIEATFDFLEFYHEKRFVLVENHANKKGYCPVNTVDEVIPRREDGKE